MGFGGRHPSQKEEIQLSLFEHNMVIYIKKFFKYIFKNPLELLSEISKVAVYKFKIQISVLLLYISIKHSQIKIKVI